MEKEFVPYNLSLRLKQLGFDEPCMAAFEDNGKLFIYWNDLASKDELFCSQKVCEKLDYECLVPTWQQAFRWFREKYPDFDFGVAKIHNGTNNYHYHINLKWEFFEGSYEEAELACLEKLIEIVENQK